MSKRESCPFCNIKDRDVQDIILANDYCLVLQIPQEVLIGSSIIIPKSHREDVFDLSTEEWDATFSLLRDTKKLLDDQYQPSGYNVGWNTGEVAGQSLFHAHLHVIPRFSDEPHAGKGIRYWIKQQENKRTNSR